MEWCFAVISTTKLNYSILLMGERGVNGVNERLIVEAETGVIGANFGYFFVANF